MQDTAMVPGEPGDRPPGGRPRSTRLREDARRCTSDRGSNSLLARKCKIDTRDDLICRVLRARRSSHVRKPLRRTVSARVAAGQVRAAGGAVQSGGRPAGRGSSGRADAL